MIVIFTNWESRKKKEGDLCSVTQGAIVCVRVCVCVCVCGLMQQKLISCSYKVHYRLEDSLEKIPLPSVGA